MVVAPGPGRFYSDGLLCPRISPGDHVNPPEPVTSPLHAWAQEAHWSMGGLGSKRLRLQGRIEGDLVKLHRTARRDAMVAAKTKEAARSAGLKPASLDPLGSDDDDVEAQKQVLAPSIPSQVSHAMYIIACQDNSEEALTKVHTKRVENNNIQN